MYRLTRNMLVGFGLLAGAVFAVVNLAAVLIVAAGVAAVVFAVRVAVNYRRIRRDRRGVDTARWTAVPPLGRAFPTDTGQAWRA